MPKKKEKKKESHFKRCRLHYGAGLLAVSSLIALYLSFTPYTPDPVDDAHAATAATGSIVLDTGADFIFGEKFYIGESTSVSTTFWINNVGGSGNGQCADSFGFADGYPPCLSGEGDGLFGIIVDNGGGPTLAQLTDRLADAINTSSLAITAVSNGVNTVSLTNDVAGAAGNVTITASFSDASWAFSGMSGGADDPSNTAPTVSSMSVTPATDATGNVEVVATLDDDDDDALSYRVEHRSGNCSAYSGFASTTLGFTYTLDNDTGISFDNSQSAGFQFTSVPTSAGANTVTTTWSSSFDAFGGDGTYCIFLTAYDGTENSTITSSTVTIDNAAPTGTGRLSVNSTSTTSVVFDFGAATTDTNFLEHKLFYRADASTGVGTFDSVITSTTDSNLAAANYNGASTTTLTGLTPGRQYVVNLVPFDSYGNSLLSGGNERTFYTLANTPGSVATSSAAGQTSLELSIPPNSNHTVVTYALYNETAELYVAADGTTTNSPVYQTTSSWDGVSITGLTADTGYSFTAVAKNGDGLLSSTSTAVTLYTAPASTAQLVSDAAITFTADQPTAVIDGDEGDNTASLQTVTIPSTVPDEQQTVLDLGRLVSNGAVATNNQITITKDSTNDDRDFSVVIPAGTTITADDNNWNGQMIMPTVRANTVVDVPGGDIGAVQQVVEIGLTGSRLTFDNAVKIVLPGQAGRIPAFQRDGENAVRIETECDDVDAPTNVVAGGDCFIEFGEDLIIWTRHFTKFFSYTRGQAAIIRPSAPVLDASTPREWKAVVINSGADITNSRNVTLFLNAVGPNEVAISEDSEFVGASFVPFSDTVSWQLSPGNGFKTVYVRFRTAEGEILDSFASIRLTGQADDASIAPQPEPLVDETPAIAEPIGEDGCMLMQGKAYISLPSPAVWLITDSCTRQLFTSPEKYFSYFSSWDDLVAVDQSRIDNVPEDPVQLIPWGPHHSPGNQALVKVLHDTRVYFLLGGNRHWITSEVAFGALGFMWDWVIDVSDALLDLYEIGTDIDTLYPPGVIIQDAQTQLYYQLEIDTQQPDVLRKREVSFIDAPTNIPVVDAEQFQNAL